MWGAKGPTVEWYNKLYPRCRLILFGPSDLHPPPSTIPPPSPLSLHAPRSLRPPPDRYASMTPSAASTPATSSPPDPPPHAHTVSRYDRARFCCCLSIRRTVEYRTIVGSDGGWERRRRRRQGGDEREGGRDRGLGERCIWNSDCPINAMRQHDKGGGGAGNGWREIWAALGALANLIAPSRIHRTSVQSHVTLALTSQPGTLTPRL